MAVSTLYFQLILSVFLSVLMCFSTFTLTECFIIGPHSTERLIFRSEASHFISQFNGHAKNVGGAQISPPAVRAVVVVSAVHNYIVMNAY